MRDALPGYLKPVAEFAYLTGWRKGEIISLKWSQVDMQGRLIRLNPDDTKNRQPRRIALEGRIEAIIKEQWEKGQKKTESGELVPAFPFVFPHNNGRRIKDFRGAWDAALEKAELPAGKLFHDFRRTAVRNMIRAGIPERVAMEISGHKTRSVFDRYNITDERDLRAAANRISEYAQSQRPIVIVAPVVGQKPVS